MSASTFSSQLVPAPVLRAMGATPSGWLRLGEQARPMGKTLLSLVDVVLYYRAELLRQVAAMSLGTASLAVIGGTVAVMTFLTMSTGGAPAGGGYNQLASHRCTAVAAPQGLPARALPRLATIRVLPRARRSEQYEEPRAI